MKHTQKRRSAFKKPVATQPNLDWSTLLTDAVEKPGKLLEAYRHFHNYSLGNLAAITYQLAARGMNPSPIATYKRWQELGRQVKKNQKALWLCQPVIIPGDTTKDEAGNTLESETRVFFKWRKGWFSLDQTEGEELPAPEPIANWDETKALAALNITRTAFHHGNGNVQGYANSRREVAINPMAQLPYKTMFHELAHIVLGHTDMTAHGFKLPTNIQEVEAESTAMLCVATLDLPGVEYCRGYIQNWLKGNEIPEKSAQAIFKAADTILKAGTTGIKETKTKATKSTKRKSAAALPTSQKASDLPGPRITARGTQSANQRQALCKQLLALLDEVPTSTTPTVTIQYGTATYTILNKQEAITKTLRKAGFSSQLDAHLLNQKQSAA